MPGQPSGRALNIGCLLYGNTPTSKPSPRCFISCYSLCHLFCDLDLPLLASRDLATCDGRAVIPCCGRPRDLQPLRIEYSQRRTGRVRVSLGRRPCVTCAGTWQQKSNSLGNTRPPLRLSTLPGSVSNLAHYKTTPLPSCGTTAENIVQPLKILGNLKKKKHSKLWAVALPHLHHRLNAALFHCKSVAYSCAQVFAQVFRLSKSAPGSFSSRRAICGCRRSQLATGNARLPRRQPRILYGTATSHRQLWPVRHGLNLSRHSLIPIAICTSILRTSYPGISLKMGLAYGLPTGRYRMLHYLQPSSGSKSAAFLHRVACAWSTGGWGDSSQFDSRSSEQQLLWSAARSLCHHTSWASR